MYLQPHSWTLLLLLLGGWSCQLSAHGYRILALCVNGHKSHLMLYMSVINSLMDRGHDITLVTTLDIKDLSAKTHNLQWIRLSESYTNSAVTAKRGGGAFDEIESMLMRIEDTAKFMQDVQWQRFMAEENHFDLMILGYLFNDYQLGVARHFNCPVAVVWTGQPIGFIHGLMGNPENRWYVPQPYDRHQYKGIKAIAFGWFEKFVEYLALYKMKEIYDQYFPHPQYPTFWEIRKTVSLAICNHHALSEGPIAPYVPGILEVGGLEYHPKRQRTQGSHIEVVDILRRHQRIIYFSFGSRVKWSLLDPSIEWKFIEAFQAFPNHTILWTYDKNCTNLQQHSPNILCKSWWPQSLILAGNSTELFISHGGKGSISDAYSFGKPILGIPLFGDQRANADKLVSRKLGIKLDIYNLIVKDIVKALHDLLESGEYKENMNRFSRLYRDRPMPKRACVIYWLEYIIRYKGARPLQSPALDMNFIEYYNIDVYGVIVITFMVIIMVFNFLEKKIAIMESK